MRKLFLVLVQMLYALCFLPYCVWLEARKITKSDSVSEDDIEGGVAGEMAAVVLGCVYAICSVGAFVHLTRNSSPLSRLLWGIGIIVGLAVLFFSHNKEMWLAVVRKAKMVYSVVLTPAYIFCIIIIDVWFSLNTHKQVHVSLWFALVANGMLLVFASAILYWLFQSLWRIGRRVVRFIGKHIIGGEEWLTVDEKGCAQKHDSLPEFVHQCLWHRWGLLRGRTRILYHSLSHLQNFWKFGRSTKQGTWVWIDPETLALLVQHNGPEAVADAISQLECERNVLLNCFQAVYDRLPGQDKGRSLLVQAVRKDLDFFQQNWRFLASGDGSAGTYERIMARLAENAAKQTPPVDTGWKPLK